MCAGWVICTWLEWNGVCVGRHASPTHPPQLSNPFLQNTHQEPPTHLQTPISTIPSFSFLLPYHNLTSPANLPLHTPHPPHLALACQTPTAQASHAKATRFRIIYTLYSILYTLLEPRGGRGCDVKTTPHSACLLRCSSVVVYYT